MPTNKTLLPLVTSSATEPKCPSLEQTCDSAGLFQGIQAPLSNFDYACLAPHYDLRITAYPLCSSASSLNLN